MRANTNLAQEDRCDNCKYSRNASKSSNDTNNLRCHYESAPFLHVYPFDWCNQWAGMTLADREHKQKYTEAYEAHMQKVESQAVDASDLDMKFAPDDEVEPE